MVDPNTLSRRERQIMDILFSQGQATVKQVQDLLDDPPTVMAVRRMLQILEEKGHLKRNQDTREVVYSPRESRKIAGSNALKHVLDTFFGGAIDEALASHFARKEEISPEQLSRLRQMIAQAKTGKNQRPKM
jgi:predicted transcriptional regulator